MEVKNHISKEFILSKISEEDIFRRYTELEVIGKKFKSPFNNERTPSCIVYSNMFFNCFSSGNKGSCFDLVMLKYGCTFYESLVMISNDFNLFNSTKYNTTEYNPVLFGIKPKQHIIKETKINIKSKKFTIKGLNYWKQYLISEKTLNKYLIKQLQSYWINENYYLLHNDEIGFAYDFNNYKYQLLFPEKPKDYKWNSNTVITDLQGFNQLPKFGNQLIITSSLKDVACLNENYNLECIAPKSESTIIPEILIEHLKLRFNDIIVYLNNDETGIKFSKQYEEKYNLKWLINPLNLSKDPSDCILYNQKNELTNFLMINNVLKN